MKLRGVLALSLAVVCLMAGIASGHIQKKSDPDDSPDLLDIRNARLTHTSERLRVGIHSWQDWPTRALDNRTIWFTLDTKGGPAADFGVNINRGNDGLQCLVTLEPNGEFVANGRPRRDGTDGASCSFKRSDVAAAG